MLDGLNEEMVRAMYETLPVELSIIDANDEVVGWNKHNDRLFHRPTAAMNMNFRECHPQKSLVLVEKIIGEMKEGKRQKARFWIDMTVNKETKEKHKVLIEFYALRDMGGKYIGCMECTTDIQDIMHLEGEKRLMDEM
jgi:DUF438 domain-containing protein